MTEQEEDEEEEHEEEEENENTEGYSEANDPRVLKVESDDIVAAAKKNGVPVEYVVFPDEGHGFVKKENEIKGYTAVLSFLDQYLRGSAQSSSAKSP